MGKESPLSFNLPPRPRLSSSATTPLLLPPDRGDPTSPTSPKSPTSPTSPFSTKSPTLSPSRITRTRTLSERSITTRILDHAVNRGMSDSAASLKAAHSYMQEQQLQQHFRLLDRDAPYGQSYGRWNIARANRQSEYFVRDIFHLLIELSTCRVIGVFWATYTITYCLFALVFWSAGTECEIGCDTYVQALCLTVETMMTIGYGVPDPYFRKCPWLSGVLLFQCLVAIIYNVCFVGLMFARVSRGTKRAATVLFSQKAILKTIGGDTFLMFRVCEMRRTQLLGAKMKCWCIAHRKPLPEQENGKYKRTISGGGDSGKLILQEPMRLERPDDNLSAELLLLLPTTVVHKIDKFSPLLGPPVDPESATGIHSLRCMQERVLYAPLQRSSEPDAGCRDSFWCQVCGSTFAAKHQLQKHLEFTAAQEKEDVAAGGTAGAPHADILSLADFLPSRSMEEREACEAEKLQRRMMDYLQTHDLEVVCVVEGTAATTSASVQARHSYTANDMVWDHEFEPCVTTTDSGHVCVDFARFHQLAPC
eukprot:TRINITY_DN14383_c0_g1_i1.p1 TRINITY_DN14383_c0_g1~~TRINITY_DN14383_c0_g1_i1.p1  ORF type:complete len:535 (-),score=65.36 TRINITY_DN14383_c0_g1_i1:51-1655(-)